MESRKKMDGVIRKTIEHLAANNMTGYYVENSSNVFSLLEKLIAPGSCIGSGDSATLEQTGIFDFLRVSDYVFLDKHQKNLSSVEKREIYLSNFCADTFITGTNAVTTDGALFNIDGNGSRVAPMIYGPKQVIVVVGVNKITENLESAVSRARQTAAPLDAKRLGKNTPCAKLGYCVDCKHPQRICNSFVLIARQFTKRRIHVIIINETLGY
jgi:hypothetical protein